MAGLLVALAVIAIMASAAVPVWKTLTQREKEAELIFRGEQYARAIGLFQRKMGPGTLPPTVEVLVKQHFLRKAYKDPVSNDDFQLLYVGQNAAGAPGGRGAAAPGAAAGAGNRPGAPGPQAGPQAGPGPGVAAGIQGVVSKSADQSIRQYNSRSHYNEWTFIHVAQVQAPGAPAGAGAPGVGLGGQSGPLGPAGQRGPLGSGAGRGGPPPRPGGGPGGGPGQGPGGGRGFGGPGRVQGPGGQGGGTTPLQPRPTR